MGLAETMEQVARGVEVVGIATLVLGLVVALVQAARVLIRGQAEEAYRVIRTPCRAVISQAPVPRESSEPQG
jgi:hypothetical protein